MTSARPRRIGGEQVRRQVEEYFRMLGVPLDRQNTGVGTYANRDGTERRVRYGARGNPDNTGTLPDGRRIEVESKATGERPTPEQLARIHRVNASNGVAFWVDDVSVAMKVMPHVLSGASVEETDGRDGPIVRCRPGCRACGGRATK